MTSSDPLSILITGASTGFGNLTARHLLSTSQQSLDHLKEARLLFELDMVRIAAERAEAVGLGVNAGHDLSLKNLGRFLDIPNVLEVSIGHAIVVESFDFGYEETLKRYLGIVTEARGTDPRSSST